MADLKINQLDPIIPVSSGSGATYSALSDADLFIVKMKVRGAAIGDEDRKLTWLELRNSLNLGQYMGTVGGNFTGDVTLNNNKALKGKQTGAGADVALIYVDTSNRVTVGNLTNLTRVQSSSVPQYVDGTGTYNFLTTKNIPAPGDLSGGAAYTKSEVDNKLTFKFDKTGGDVSGDINLTQNATRLYGITTDGIKASIAYVTAGNTVNYGHSTLHTNLVSTDVPSWVSADGTYQLITKNNLPVPGDINAYTKTEVDTRLSTKFDKVGGELTGSITVPYNKAYYTKDQNGATAVAMIASDDYLQIGEGSAFKVKVKSAANPTVSVAGSAEYQFYHEGYKPTAAALGLTDTVTKASTALQDGAFGIGTIPKHKADAGFLSVTDATQFFVQDGSATEQRFGALGAGIHLYYGAVGTGINTQYRSASLFIDQNNNLISKWSSVDYTGAVINTQTATYFSDVNPPTSSQVGSYSKTETDGLYARKGANADITALNALTGALKVGANATQPLEVTTLQQVQALTSGTAGAVVGVVGGFIGAVQWFGGTRSYAPAGYAPSDGQILNRADYPDTWAAINSGALPSVSDADWVSTVSNRGKFSTGNGTTTFRMSDLNGAQSTSIPGLFLRGSPTDTNVSFVAQSGLPNISGAFSSVFAGTYGSVLEGQSGAFVPTGILVYQIPNLGNLPGAAVSPGRGITTTLDASRSSSVYGRSTTEVRPNSIQGVWLIRVSNNFEAANTEFKVYTGAATLPAAGTATGGGSLRSIYTVAGAEDHSVTLKTNRAVGGASSASLVVTQQAQGSQAFKTSTYQFAVDGTFHATKLHSLSDTGVDGALYVTGATTLAGGMSVTGVSNFYNSQITQGNNTIYATPASAPVGSFQNAPSFKTQLRGRGAYSDPLGCYAAFYTQEYVGQYQSAIINLNGFNADASWSFRQTGGTYSPLGQLQYSGSDVRLKKDFNLPKDGAEDRIKSIGVVEYSLTSSGKRCRGYIAQQLDEVDELYTFKGGEAKDQDGKEFEVLNVDQTAIIADLISTVQSLMAKVEKLEAAAK